MKKPLTGPSIALIAIVTIITIVLFSKCSKEYSYEGGNAIGTATGSAVYSLAGAGGECLGSLINGDYYVSTAVGAGNVVVLQVNVATTGIYEVSTNLANGIRFAAKGTFTITGIQSITLQAMGIPLSTGSFTYTLPVGSGCSFVIKVTQAPAAPAAYTFNGAPNSCSAAKVNGDYISGKALLAGNTVVLSVNVTAVGAYTIQTDTLDNISFSHSGVFNTTGTQDVILVGSGIPDMPRNLLFTPYGNSLGCTFGITVLNPEPLATYVLESGYGSPNPCTCTVAGNYTAHTPLTNTNSVSLRVFVTVAGNFTIATKTINGMIFSYTGTFTTTGSQYVTLYGSGAPVSAGTNTFIPAIVGPSPLGGQTCAFTIVAG